MQYHLKSNIQLFNNIRLFSDIGNCIPYSQLEIFLFSGKVPEINRMLLLHKKFVIEYNSTLYFILEKLDEYINFSLTKVNFSKNTICPINLFELISNKNMDITPFRDNIKLFQLLTKFKNFIKEKNDLNSTIILKYFWSDTFNGIVTETNDNPYLISIKFQKNGKPLILTISNYMNNYKNSLSLNANDSDMENEFNKVYDTWVQEFLMENPDNYIISCLTNITGNENFATMIFESHKTKNEFNLSINELDMILSFKSLNSIKEYHKLFSEKYPHLYIITNKNMFVTFEGFNKYLLNLEVKFLNNFESKERINTLYYNVMDELVNCYERLYNFTKHF